MKAAPFLNWKPASTTARSMPAFSRYSMLCGSRLSPMEKRGNCSRSITSTWRPCWRSSAAATEPAGPAPTMRISAVSICIASDMFAFFIGAKTGNNQPDQRGPQQHRQAEGLQRRGRAQAQQAEGQNGIRGGHADRQPWRMIAAVRMLLHEDAVIDADTQQQHQRQD